MCFTHLFHTIARDTEYWEKLKQKLVEEAEEFAQDESITALADLQEVIHAICEYKGFDPVEIEQHRKAEASERGLFKKRIILETSFEG